MNRHAKWIWIDKQTDCINQYADFRKTFSVDKKQTSHLCISADSSYQIWINGAVVDGNQFSDWPQYKTYNKFDITDYIRQGENSLAVKVHHIGSDFSTYAKGMPGLIFEVCCGDETVALSDENCRCRYCKAFANGAVSVVSRQLGYNFQYNAEYDDLWYKIDYSDSDWAKAVELADAVGGYWRELTQRPLDMLEYDRPADIEVVSSGKLIRTIEMPLTGQTMMSDFLSPDLIARPSQGVIQNYPLGRKVLSVDGIEPLVLSSDDCDKGVYAILDLGCEDVGILHFDIDAPEGTILDIAHGEHLDDLRIRAAIDGRNFADRYICKQGRQVWQYPFRRLGGRYLELHIPKLKGRITIYHFTIIPVKYSFDGSGYFYCPDDMLNRIWELSKRTLVLCAHEHYEDCPWREQALYAADSRLQALFGYYAFGEYRMPRACWELIRKSQREDGLLELVSPGKANISIPGFSLQWIIAVYELFLFSGNRDVITDNYPVICNIIENSIDRLTESGVVGNSTSPEHWNFYEWTAGFEGIEEGSYSGQNGRLDAAYNLYLLEAIRCTLDMGMIIAGGCVKKFSAAYDRIYQSFNDIFWDEDKRLYASFREGGKLGHYSQLVQALAIREGVVSDRYITELSEAIKTSPQLTQSEVSSKMIVYESLLNVSDENINYVLEDVKRVFGGMIDKGATSLWETQQGADAFERAGSLCHGWASVFSYIAGAYLLGIKPLKPGFSEFTVRPLMSFLSNVTGIVRTSEGDIEVSCTRTEQELIIKLRHPKAFKPRFELPRGVKVRFI
jgi:alpha-L-rhamnosidase